MSTEPRCRTKLLSDAPASTDEFLSHQPVADAIAELICSEDDLEDQSKAGGRCIGLEGVWGSGKSTVVNLLEEKLRSYPDCKVIKFDAWSHQGDPLRRSFLETMIEELRDWITDQKHWDECKDELAKRREVTRTTKTPVLFFWGKALIFAILLFPVGLMLLSAGLNDDLQFWWFGRGVDWYGTAKTVGGLFLLSLPLLMLLLRWVCRRERIKERLRSSKRLSFLVDPKEANDCWCIIAHTFDTDTKSLSIKSPDPSSIEFGNRFGKLMQEVLAPSGRQIVLVLDNLDRVSAKDALSVWSTMQTFLSASEHNLPEWLKNFWVLVPYDREGISRLWNKRAEANDERVGENQTDSPKANDKQVAKGEADSAKDTASHFLDKAFQRSVPRTATCPFRLAQISRRPPEGSATRSRSVIL